MLYRKIVHRYSRECSVRNITDAAVKPKMLRMERTQAKLSSGCSSRSISPAAGSAGRQTSINMAANLLAAASSCPSHMRLFQPVAQRQRMFYKHAVYKQQMMRLGWYSRSLNKTIRVHGICQSKLKHNQDRLAQPDLWPRHDKNT